MKLSKKQTSLLKKRNIVVFSSANLKGKPRSIFVEVNKVSPEEIIVTDNQMIQTRNNLVKNNKVALLAFEANYSYCIKIDAIAKYQTAGKYFELIKSLKTNKGFDCKGVVVLKVKKVEEVC